MELSLFGAEVQELINKPEPEVVVKTRKPKKREPKKKKEPTINDLRWDIHREKDRIKELQAQDESGWDEFEKSVKGKEVNIKLCEAHISYYRKQLSQLREPFNPLLTKWRAFIQQICMERGQEIDKIWFDTSAPYDVEIEVRMKGHSCWNSCISFRFRGGEIHAFDGFRGTNFVYPIAKTDEEIEKVIKENLELVFARKCCGNEPETEHRKIEIDESGWIIDEFIDE